MKKALVLCLILSGCTAYHALKQVPAPAGAKELKDIVYYDGPGQDAEKHRLDVYSPGGKATVPVVVFFHGGSWKRGDRDARLDTYQKLARKFMARGLLVVVPSYRLAPEHKYPAFVRDGARAVAWVQKNVEGHGGDPRRIFLMGHSAGAHIAALLGADPRWLEEAGADHSRIEGIVGLSGPYDIVYTGGRVNFLAEDAFGEDREVWKQATVKTHLGKGRLPRFLLAIANWDPASLHRQADDLIQAIRKAGGEVKRFEAKGRGHLSILIRLGEPDDPLSEAIEKFIRNR